jgi:hypothetical protein
MSFVTFGFLRNHAAVHVAPSYGCNHCSGRFTRSFNARRHFVNAHKIDGRSTSE